ncbi:MAG: urease accessory protein UreD [Rhizobiaceae bacterium]
MQRTYGSGRLVVHYERGRTGLSRVYQEGAAKIRFPRTNGSSALEAVLINTAGGLTGGDRLDWQIEAAAHGALTLTTQACERIYRSIGGDAEIAVRLKARQGARINWMPQETIFFDQSRLSRTLVADLAPGASLLAVEASIFGRLAGGEAVRSVFFHDRWRIHRADRLVHGEDQRLDGDAAALLAPPAMTGSAAAVATILLVGDEASVHIDQVRRLLGEFPDIASGASTWKVAGTGKLLARLVANDSYTLRKVLVPLLCLLNGEAPVPKIWSM